MAEIATMEEYICETPKVFAKNIKNRKNLLKDLLDIYINNDYADIYIIASGSSNNACNCALMFIEKILNINVKIVTPFYFCNYVDELKDEVLYIVVSQSGYSTNSIKAAEKIKDMNKLSIALTGDVDSDIKNSVDVVIDYGVGKESNGYVTKGVVTLAEFLMLFALETAFEKEKITLDEYENILSLLDKANLAHDVVYEDVKSLYENNKEDFKNMKKMYILSSGANFATAKEGCLKVGETVHCMCADYEIEEYIHGPNIQVKNDYYLFIIDSLNKTHERIMQIKNASKYFTDKIYLLSGEFIANKVGVLIKDREIFDLISPLYNVVYFQYLSYKITEDNGLWDDNGDEYDRFDACVHSKTPTYEKMYEEGLVN